jgi:hypothetical protein
MDSDRSPLEQQAADALRRARQLPVGAERNDLRQLATGLLWLHRRGMEALVENRRIMMTGEPEHPEAPRRLKRDGI